MRYVLNCDFFTFFNVSLKKFNLLRVSLTVISSYLGYDSNWIIWFKCDPKMRFNQIKVWLEQMCYQFIPTEKKQLNILINLIEKTLSVLDTLSLTFEVCSDYFLWFKWPGNKRSRFLPGICHTRMWYKRESRVKSFAWHHLVSSNFLHVDCICLQDSYHSVYFLWGKFSIKASFLWIK